MKHGLIVPSRHIGPGGHMSGPEESRSVEGNRECQSYGNGVGKDGRRGGKDGATSGSIQVDTKLLAEDMAHQEEGYKRTMEEFPGRAMQARCATAPESIEGDHAPSDSTRAATFLIQTLLERYIRAHAAWTRCKIPLFYWKPLTGRFCFSLFL